jgi:EmrB/QacA subfamily drug resistance transporter
VTLGLVLLAMILAVIDTTVLNVGIPTIQKELDAGLPAVQWVITGYALVFASLLVVGGRLGDIYGPRRLVMVGAGIFGAGSLVASASTSIAMLIISKAVIQGSGAALLTPNTLSLIANTFYGAERTRAFAIWATAMSTGAVSGPILGGYLITYHSWRWAFRINVIVAPIVVLGLWRLARPDGRSGRRPRLDLVGSVLVALATFLVVFGLSQGSKYGYLRPVADFVVLGQRIWPSTAALSVVPLAFVLGLVGIVAFVRVESAKERRGFDPLFAISQFRVRTFSLTTIIMCFVSFGQLGVAYLLALYLQGSRHLTPMQNGIWVIPSAGSSIIGSLFSSRLARRVGITNALRVGLVLHISGVVGEAFLLSSDLSYAYVLPAFVVYGFGGGIVMALMNPLLLRQVDPASAGAASGISATSRQAATACGVAMCGALFTVATSRYGIHDAIRPAMLAPFLALLAALVVAALLPQLDRHPPDAGADAPVAG